MIEAVIAVDFDGTLCRHEFPNIGAARYDLINLLIRLREQGHKLILWTCREGEYLNKAIIWCSGWGLHFDAVNENVSEHKDQEYAHRKVYADYYLDDRK